MTMITTTIITIIDHIKETGIAFVRNPERLFDFKTENIGMYQDVIKNLEGRATSRFTQAKISKVYKKISPFFEPVHDLLPPPLGQFLPFRVGLSTCSTALPWPQKYCNKLSKR